MISYQNQIIPLPRELPFRSNKYLATATCVAIGFVLSALLLGQSQKSPRASLLAQEQVVSTPHKLLTELQRLDKFISGEVHFHSDFTRFEEASQVWVRNVDSPFAVIEVANERDVKLAVPVLARLYRKYKIPFRIRSGGHHKAGYSTIGRGVVLSLKRLNHSEILDSGRATIGPSLTASQFLNNILAPHGFGGVIGFCNSVAEGGFALGGGWGMQSRLHGLGADNILSLRVVLANGTLITASPINHADLYWAMRGAGGGSFGVVTELEYRIHKASDTALYVGLSLRPLIMAKFLRRIGEMEGSLPGNFILDWDGTPTTEHHTVSILWSGKDDFDMEGSDAYIQDLVDSILSPDDERVEYEVKFFSWSGMASATYYSLPQVWAASCWTGFLHSENNTEMVWLDIMDIITSGVIKSSPYLLPDVELWGGAIEIVPWNETAFPYRSAIYNLGVILVIPADEPNAQQIYEEQTAIIDAWWPNVAKYLTGSYVNYPMKSLGSSDYARVYWGDNLERLVHVKKQYDPDNLFTFPLAVPVEL
jgi:FAD/FMN-containing dehydrogenase